MQRFGLFFTQNWYINLPVWQKELVMISLELYAREERLHSQFSDYSFIVFPMGKAYEGFLKKVLYDWGFITQTMYMDKRFRIGRALNPDVNPQRQDQQWVYGRFAESCGGDVARFVWDTWLECRNQVFHYFPDNQKKLSLSEAERKIEMMALAMEKISMCALP
jgi:hypothetical protein